jgi:hypothetical protein
MAACVVSACGESPLETEVPDLVVVEAYLYAGERVTNVRLSESVVLGEDPSEVPVINDADVALIKNDVRYELSPVGEDGQYHYEMDDLTVESGDVFRIEVTYLGHTAFGQTVVPEPPVGVAIDTNTMVAPLFDFGTGRGGGMGAMDNVLVATWDNPNQLLHYVVIEGLQDDTETILPPELLDRIGEGRFRFVTEPTLDDFYEIRVMMLQNLGRHAARIYRVNQEYADLYENRSQDSRDLNEPPSNIEGGLGIFSAFASVSVVFEVVRQEG